MLPENFSEKCIRVYCKLSDADPIAIVTKCFSEACEALDLIPPKVSEACDTLDFILSEV